MTCADRLAISNSTFSFTAAMLNQRSPSSAHAFVRPVPDARALVPFDPWDSYPLLVGKEALRCELYADRGSYT